MTTLPRVSLAVAEGLADALPPSDAMLLANLRSRGVDARAATWSRTADWEDDPGLVVIRACWDYHRRLDEFTAWLAGLRARGIRVRNSPEVLQWNARKRYLHDLAGAGVPTVRTALIRARGIADPVETLHVLAESDRTRWTHVVIKPEVSASGEGTFRATLPLTPASTEAIRAKLQAGDLLVQPFRREIVEHGEVSLVFFAGTFSHAVLKRAREGEFRVQKDHGGSVEVIEATPEHIAFGARTLAAAARVNACETRDILYARVDMLPLPAGPELMELELIEPELFLDRVPAATGRFGDVVVAAAARLIPSA